MKTLLILVSICLLSCDNKTAVENNTENTIRWIETHKKPIQVETFIYDKPFREYTLFSADNKVLATGTVNLELPTIIEDSGSVKKNREIIKRYQEEEKLRKESLDLQYEIKRMLGEL